MLCYTLLLAPPEAFKKPLAKGSLSSKVILLPFANLFLPPPLLFLLLLHRYYSRLSILVDCFAAPLTGFVEAECVNEANLAVDGFTVEAVRSIFANISQIRDLTKTLLDDLTTALESPSGKIGPVFCRVAPFLRMYLTYYHGTPPSLSRGANMVVVLLPAAQAAAAARPDPPFFNTPPPPPPVLRGKAFPAGRSALEQLRTAPWAHAFLAACERQPACRGRGLRDFLIEPVQRVPRYEMLIKEVRWLGPGGRRTNDREKKGRGVPCCGGVTCWCVPRCLLLPSRELCVRAAAPKHTSFAPPPLRARPQH